MFPTILFPLTLVLQIMAPREVPMRKQPTKSKTFIRELRYRDTQIQTYFDFHKAGPIGEPTGTSHTNAKSRQEREKLRTDLAPERDNTLYNDVLMSPGIPNTYGWHEAGRSRPKCARCGYYRTVNSHPVILCAKCYVHNRL